MAVGSPAQRLAQTPVSDLRLVGLEGLAVQAREAADRAVQQLLLLPETQAPYWLDSCSSCATVALACSPTETRERC